MVVIVVVAVYAGGLRTLLQPMTGGWNQAIVKVAVASALFLFSTVLLALPVALTDPSFRAEMARQQAARDRRAEDQAGPSVD